jgi:hypothetical protein
MTTGPNTLVSTRSKQQVVLEKTIDGLHKHAQDLTTLVIAATTYKTADLATRLQVRLDALKTVESTKAAWQAAVKNDYDERTKTKTLLSGLRQSLLVAFSGSIDSLGDFGLVGRKPVVVSPEKRVAAQQKAKATRAARHTMGKKQKVL